MASSCAEHLQVVGDGSGAAKGSEGAAPTRPSTQKAARHLSSSRVHRVLRSWHPGLMVCPRERQSSLADPGAASGGRATGSTTGGHTAYRYSTSTLQVLYEYNSTSTLQVLYECSTGTLRVLYVLYGYSACTRMTGVCVRHRGQIVRAYRHAMASLGPVLRLVHLGLGHVHVGVAHQ